jgi:hypothetical protein
MSGTATGAKKMDNLYDTIAYCVGTVGSLAFLAFCFWLRERR